MGTKAWATLGSIALCVAAGCGAGGLQPTSGPDAASATDTGATFAYRMCNRDPRNQTKFLGVEPVAQDGGSPCFASYEVSFGTATASCSCAAAVDACGITLAALEAEAAACLAPAQ